MATMFPPKKNTAFTLAFPIRDADGDLVTGASSLDSEVSIDGAAFADCTNEATEIGSTGIYTLALTASEMNGDYIIVQTKTGTAGAKTAVNVMYTTARQIDDLAYPATSGRSMVVDANGLVDANMVKLGPTGAGTAQTARDIGASVLLSNGTGTGQIKIDAGYISPNWADIGSPTTTVNLSGTTVKTATDVETDTADIQSRLPAALVSGRIDASVGEMAANTITAAATAADYLAEINAQVLDVIATDTFAEPSAVVAATCTIKDALMWLKTVSRNKKTQSSTTKVLRNDADNGNIATASVSDAAGTYTHGEWA